MLILHMFLILAHLEQDKLKWTGYGQPPNYGQRMDKKTGFVHTLSTRSFVVVAVTHIRGCFGNRRDIIIKCVLTFALS